MHSFDFHSPIEQLDIPEFNAKKILFHVKRDDTFHPFISGNKWRKLRLVLEKAREQSKNHLVTFGGVWSNHLLATACAGAKFGFKTTAFVRGEHVSNPNLSMCKAFGMELIFVSREDYKDKALLFEKHAQGDLRAFFIDEGGYSEEAALGCARIIEELDQEYDHIFCACGTGTTIAGLCMGKERAGIPTRLHGIPVLRGGEFLYEDIARLCGQTALGDLTLHTHYHFGGYAKATPALIDFITSFCSKTGILIEPVYTGKLFYGVFDLLAQNYFKPGEKILAIHTGGLTGILGMHEKF